MSIVFTKETIKALVTDGYELQEDIYNYGEKEMTFDEAEAYYYKVSRYLSKLTFTYQYIKAYGSGIEFFWQDEMEELVEFFKMMEASLQQTVFSKPDTQRPISDVINSAFNHMRKGGRPTGKPKENARLTRYESVKLFYLLSEAKAIPRLDNTHLARLFETLTGYGQANARIDLTKDKGLSPEQKENIIAVLQETIAQVKEF